MAVTARNARKWLVVLVLGRAWGNNPGWDRWYRGRSARACAGAGVFGVGIRIGIGIVLLIVSPLSVRSVSCCSSI